MDTCSSTGTVDAQAPVFTRVQQAKNRPLIVDVLYYIVLKNQPLVHGRPGFRRVLKQTVEPRLPFRFQNDRLSQAPMGF